MASKAERRRRNARIVIASGRSGPARRDWCGDRPLAAKRGCETTGDRGDATRRSLQPVRSRPTSARRPPHRRPCLRYVQPRAGGQPRSAPFRYRSPLARAYRASGPCLGLPLAGLQSGRPLVGDLGLRDMALDGDPRRSSTAVKGVPRASSTQRATRLPTRWGD